MSITDEIAEIAATRGVDEECRETLREILDTCQTHGCIEYVRDFRVSVNGLVTLVLRGPKRMSLVVFLDGVIMMVLYDGTKSLRRETHYDATESDSLVRLFASYVSNETP